MANISTQYVGLSLKSPIIVSSSGLTNSIKKIQEFESAGAGAIVLKSIFEEQMENEIAFMSQDSDYPEVMDYLQHYIKSNELNKHLSLIRDAAKSVDIPIIASINCYRSDTWLEYAQELQEAGISALELNIMRIDTDLKQVYGIAEEEIGRMIFNIKRVLKVPVLAKLSKYYTNICHLCNDISLSGGDGVVLFNRSFMPNIDIDKEEITTGEVFSAHSDLSDSLRYVALVKGHTPDLTVALSTGVRDGSDVIRALLSGADGVQMCTALYQNGSKAITSANQYLKEWMDNKGYHAIEEFRGRLSAHRNDHETLYLRSQFMKHFATYDPTPTNAMDPQKYHSDLSY